jgi:hypothetical protein
MKGAAARTGRGAQGRRALGRGGAASVHSPAQAAGRGPHRPGGWAAARAAPACRPARARGRRTHGKRTPFPWAAVLHHARARPRSPRSTPLDEVAVDLLLPAALAHPPPPLPPAKPAGGGGAPTAASCTVGLPANPLVTRQYSSHCATLHEGPQSWRATSHVYTWVQRGGPARGGGGVERAPAPGAHSAPCRRSAGWRRRGRRAGAPGPRRRERMPPRCPRRRPHPAAALHRAAAAQASSLAHRAGVVLRRIGGAPLDAKVSGHHASSMGMRPDEPPLMRMQAAGAQQPGW